MKQSTFRLSEILAPTKGLIGGRVTGLGFKRYQQLGLECAALQFSNQLSLVFRAAELKLGRYETYSLAISNGSSVECSDEKLAIDLTIEAIEIWEREEWLEASEPSVGIIGDSPSSVNYGPVGRAPKGVEACRIVSAFVLHGVELRVNKTLMICVSNYPGLISYTALHDEIGTFLESSSLAEKVQE